MTAFKMHDIDGSPDDVNLMLDIQDQMQLFSVQINSFVEIANPGGMA